MKRVHSSSNIGKYYVNIYDDIPLSHYGCAIRLPDSENRLLQMLDETEDEKVAMAIVDKLLKLERQNEQPR